MTPSISIADILGAPLSPDWTVEGLAEQLLNCIVTQNSAGPPELAINGEDSDLDRQSRRLLRPLLACLATKSAAEAGTQPSLYGGSLAFKRRGPDGPLWILGEFENRPDCLQLTLHQSIAPPAEMGASCMSEDCSSIPPVLTNT